MTLRKLTLADVTVTLNPEPEDMSPIGYFMRTEEPDKDREMEREIARRSDAGDAWAWCCAAVTVEWDGFSATQYVGACSYEDEEDFRKNGSYEDMVEEALDELNGTLAGTYEKLCTLLEEEGLTLAQQVDRNNRLRDSGK